MGGEVGRAMIDRDIIMEIIRNEDWREVAKYLRELKEDLRRGFERLNECLACPPNNLLCGEVARLVESYERALLAALMLRCLLNEALKVVEDGKLGKRLSDVLGVVDELISFLNEKRDLVHELMNKCKPLWGDPE